MLCQYVYERLIVGDISQVNSINKQLLEFQARKSNRLTPPFAKFAQPTRQYFTDVGDERSLQRQTGL